MLRRMVERFPSDDTARVVVRCGEDLRDRLAALAKSNGRSANAEAVMALENWISRVEDPSHHVDLQQPIASVHALIEMTLKKIIGNPEHLRALAEATASMSQAELVAKKKIDA